MHRLLQQRLASRRSVVHEARFLREAEEGRLLHTIHNSFAYAANKNCLDHTKDHLRQHWPYYAYILLLGLGMLAFYGLDNLFPPSYDTRVTGPEICMGHTGFPGYLFFCLSATTTIGFGTLYPCNVVSRIFGIFYCLLGIPITLLILARVGEAVCNFVQHLHDKMPPRYGPDPSRPGSQKHQHQQQQQKISQRKPSKNQPRIMIEDMNANKNGSAAKIDETGLDDLIEDHSSIPISIGLSLIAIFVLLCSLYYVTAEHYGMLESVYYGFYTLIAGDLQVRNVEYGFFIFVLVLLGFGMVATTYDIIQQNIENITRRVQKELQRHQDAILNGEIESDQDPDMLLDSIMRRYSTPFLRMSMRGSQRRALQETSNKVVNRARAAVEQSNTKGTQLDGRERHFHVSQSTWSAPRKESVKVQAKPSFRDAGHQNAATKKDSISWAHPVYVDTQSDACSPVQRKESDSQTPVTEHFNAKVATDNLVLYRDIEIGTEDRVTSQDAAMSTSVVSSALVESSMQTSIIEILPQPQQVTQMIPLQSPEPIHVVDADTTTEVFELREPSPPVAVVESSSMVVPDLVASHTQTTPPAESLTNFEECACQCEVKSYRDTSAQYEDVKTFAETWAQIESELSDQEVQSETKLVFDGGTQYENYYFTNTSAAQTEEKRESLKTMSTQVESIPKTETFTQFEAANFQEEVSTQSDVLIMRNEGTVMDAFQTIENGFQTDNPKMQDSATSSEDHRNFSNKRISVRPSIVEESTDTFDFMDYIKRTHGHTAGHGHSKHDRKPQWRL